MAIEKKFVQEGYVKASMNEYFTKQLSKAGYGGMEINRTPMGTQITVYAEKPGMVIGKAGKVIRKLTRDIDRMYDMDNPQIDAQEVKKPELNAQMMATRLASSIERGWYFRKAGHNTLRAIMNSGALGCEIVISGKLTGARSRVEKLVDGYIKHAGKPVDDIVDEGFATAVKKLGTLGCKVRIIPPGAVLPDAFDIRTDVVEDVTEAVAPEAAKADVTELVEKESEGEVADEEETVEVAEEVAEAGVAEEASAEEVEEESCAEEAAESDDSIPVEDLGDEQRRLVDGVWQHKHEGYDYWHPVARVHKEG
ncbi:SSU ribosomal protein S3P [Methanolobus tindarius DSM 2278]|jgi:small subunit ribosomal protein S3|uniref:Small ribosomal subunit protein uS3 n=1 Tax=Methanolobus tindarius DSM 2278 TaxID=1090322 RepID=W9DY86_METTI|nr:30S ribosomal protein S3 [Methanolobus tindarius]ETA68662.1 SSU ribosomal protein S3P [Methanolobus tindarius DSM 2278]